jgi:hypothetical protein
VTEIDNALDERMMSDSDLTNLLGTFRGMPNVFLMSELPDGVAPPYIAVPASPSSAAHDTKTSVGRVHIRDIGCYTAANGSPAGVDAIANRVWELFHRHPLVVAGWDNIIVDVQGPVVAPTDHTLYGRIVTVSMTLWKSAT